MDIFTSRKTTIDLGQCWYQRIELMCWWWRRCVIYCIVFIIVLLVYVSCQRIIIMTCFILYFIINNKLINVKVCNINFVLQIFICVTSVRTFVHPSFCLTVWRYLSFPYVRTSVGSSLCPSVCVSACLHVRQF